MTGGHADRERPSRYSFSTRSISFDGRHGHLFTPDRPVDPPVVVLAPGAGLPWRATLEATAERLAQRGYAALAFDHRGFGDLDGDRLLSPSRQRADLEAALETARDAPAVDGDRLALWGMDLAGGTALAVAAESFHVDAVVARFPVLAGKSLLPSWLRPRLRGLARGVADYPVAAVGRFRDDDPAERGLRVPLFGDSDETAAIAGSGAARGARNALGREPGTTPARSLVKLQRHDVSDAVSDLGCPALFVAGERDEVAPPKQVTAACDDAVHGSLVRVPVGHYDALSGPELTRTLSHELAFLDTEL